jgi:hypothetical protein
LGKEIGPAQQGLDQHDVDIGSGDTPDEPGQAGARSDVGDPSMDRH